MKQLSSKASPRSRPAATAAWLNGVDRTGVLSAACRDSLLTFAEVLLHDYHGYKLHAFLARQGEACVRSERRNLCLSCPPRMGKSSLMVVAFSAWYLTNHPEREIILACYSQGLSDAFSQQVRELLESPRYLRMFPPIVSGRGGTSRSWKTRAGGGLFATSVGGGGVGRGADLYLIDDIFKNRAEANSATWRAKVWQWYNSAVVTRLSPKGTIVVLGVRWHQDDLIGRLNSPDRVRDFEQQNLHSTLFNVVALEAICEHPETDPLGRQLGEGLWPERWPVAQMRQRKLEIGSNEFAAQYQQRPVPPEGNLINVAHFRRLEASEVPRGLTAIWGWDLAYSTTTHADYSVGVLGALDPAGNIYLLDLRRSKRSWLAQKENILAGAKSCGEGTVIAVESGSASKGLCEELRKAAAGRYRIKEVQPSSDKVTRANPWIAKAEAGMFFVVRAEWNQDFFDELRQFPHGEHDDQVDAISVLYEGLRRRDILCIA